MVSPHLILDTDLDTDCDDVGALAMAHAFHRRGVIRLDGVVCSAPVPWCGPCAVLLNAHAGAPDLPVGVMAIAPNRRAPRFDVYDEHRRRAESIYGPAGLYNQVLVQERFGGAVPALPDAVALYRRLLSAAPDGAVTVCAIGTLSALAALLDSPADDASPLAGPDLVRRKVGLLVTMAIGTYPAGRDTFNWVMDCEGAARVLNDWPGELAVSPAGEEVQTGAALSRACSPANPFRRAYEIHRGGPERSRSSWDQVALLYAATGAGEVFREIVGKGLRFNAATGSHVWTDTPTGPPRRQVMPIPPADHLARIIEPLMVEGATTPA